MVIAVAVSATLPELISPETVSAPASVMPADIGASSVPATAMTMPATPAATPWRAVLGVLSHRREKMNRAAASR